MSVSCPDCGAVAGYGNELAHKSGCRSQQRWKMPVHEQWTCGHVAIAMCSECYQELVQRANALSLENARLRAELRSRGPIDADERTA